MNLLSPLKKWVISNKYYLKSGQSKNEKPTHYLLDGGIWKIPMKEYHTFLKLLATDLSNGERHYLSENKTDIFRLVVDLDFYEDSEITLDQISIIVNILNDIIISYDNNIKFLLG